MGPFGGPVQFREAEVGPPTTPAEVDVARVRAALDDLNQGAAGVLRIYRPAPTAAFATRDVTAPGYAEARKRVTAHGFSPVERVAGGRLAIYDENALVIDLVAPHPAPRDDTRARFDVFATLLSGRLHAFGANTEVGELAGEYCPGAYSVHAERRLKLVGIAQRITRRGYHLGAVITVQKAPATRTALIAAYDALALAFNPGTFGAFADIALPPAWPTLADALAKDILALGFMDRADIDKG